jgi:hypothetical protein
MHALEEVVVMTYREPAGNARLEELRMKLAEREHLHARRVELGRERDALLEKLGTLGDQIGEEGRAIESLEGTSLTGLLHRLKGDREKLLAEEKHRLLAAQARFDHTTAELQRAEVKLKALETRWQQLESVPSEYQQARTEHDRHEESEATRRHPELAGIADELGRLRALQKEVGEAVAAGQVATAALEGTLQVLGHASGWAATEMATGLGQTFKEIGIQNAQTDIMVVQQNLVDFRRELEQVRRLLRHPIPGLPDLPLEELDYSGLVQFGDAFMENIIAEVVVQQRLAVSQQSTVDTLQQIGGAMRGLRSLQDGVSRRCATLEKERRRLLES